MTKRQATRPKASKKAKKPKEKSISKLIRAADRLHSISVRNKGAWMDSEGVAWNKCYTCLRDFPVKKLHCAHYLSRYYKSARWDEDNTRPCCYICNVIKKGDLVSFRRNLVKEIGVERVDAVEAKRDISIKLSREYLEQLILSLL